MSLTEIYPSRPQFSIGRALSDSFGVIFRNVKPMAIIAVAVLAAEFAIRYSLAGSIDGEISGDTILSLISYGLITAPVTYVTFQDLRGHQAGIGETVSAGLQKMVRVIGATLAVGLAIIVPIPVVGFVVLSSSWGALIPLFIGAFVYAATIFAVWYVVIPVQVVEHVSFFGAFGRASDLTRGRRWAVLGLVLVFFVLVIFVVLVVAMLAGLVAVSSPVSALVFIIPLCAFVTVYGATVPTVTYCLLRLEKEGVGIEEIVKVFD